MHQGTHPLDAIATAEAVAAWLDELGLGDYAATFAERGWYGGALLDAPDDPSLADVIADAANRERLSTAVRRLLRRAALPDAALSVAELNAPAAACRRLGADWSRQPWLATLIDTWPGPIAHEARALGELLAAGNAAAALWQLRDLAEVLIKLPAAALAAEAERRDPDGPLAARVHEKLYGYPPPAMGTWRDLLCEDLAPGLRDAAGEPSAPPVLGLVRLILKADGKPTLFAQALLDQVVLRNREGHGAWRRDQTEIVATLRHWLLGDLPRPEWASIGMDKHPKPTPLNKALAEAVGQAPWGGLTLAVRLPGGDGIPLVGAASIPDHRDAPGADGLQPAPVLLQQPDAEPLDLAPHLAARVCVLCGYRDLFFFNGHDRRAHRFDLLDYRRGHRMARHWHQVPDLHRHAGRRPLPPPAEDDPGPLGLGRASTLALFDTLAFEARYLSPDWLRAPLRDFIAGNDRGVLWLQAPGHVGKSLFVHGLQAHLDDAPLLPGEPPRVAAVFIRREYSYGPARLLPLLEAELKRSLDLADDNEQRLPRIEEQAADKPAALAAGLAAYRRLARARTGFDGPLLICLDGLDELRPPDAAGSLLDFIPRPEALPERTYLLFTSRPFDAEGCPPWVRERTEHLRAGGLAPRVADLHDPGYRALLRAYFDRELAGAAARLEAEAVERGAAPAAARTAAAERLDALYQAVVDKADGLFLYLAFLIDRIRDQGIPADPAAIRPLPARAELFHGYLDQLRDDLGPKHADLALTLVLTLAAAERAHTWLISQPEWPPELEQDWHGLDLDVLAGLTHQTGADGHAELLYLLLRLRPVLGTWRAGSGASAHYRLGVRGLTDALEGHPDLGPRLLAIHRRLADAALALAGEAPEAEDAGAEHGVPKGAPAVATEAGDAPTRPLLLRQALAHAILGGEDEQADAVAGNRRLITLIRIEAEASRRAMDLPAAIVGNTCWLLHARQMARTGDTTWRNALASAYDSRGLDKRDAGDHGPAAALADHDAAIAIGEDLRRLLEPDGRWEVELRKDLAGAYSNRGAAKEAASGHGPAAALADYDAAIAIGEDLRRLLEPDGRWEVALRSYLASAYGNRGAAKRAATGHGPAAALADHDAAIKIEEDLRRLLEPDGRWEVKLRNDLASAYGSRGNAKQAAGGHGPAAALAD
ncbi:hypothetical protein, partial [Thiohalocapsa sp. ML1]|uniref:hypothetical protein n=1 Tax=Thiohalocapsa sp. ML1 TaxID=1431688 RepID=UPI000B192903